jgi:hypothetical protein
VTPEPAAARRRFKPLPFTEARWMGTNHAELNAIFGAGWEESLEGHPLTVGNWLFRLDGHDEVFVMATRIRNVLTEPPAASHD